MEESNKFRIAMDEVQKIVNSYFGRDVEIIPDGENDELIPDEQLGYTILHREVNIKVKANESILHLLAKIIPVDGMCQEAFDYQISAKKEFDAYTRAIPALIKFQQEWNIPKDRILDIFPKFYGGKIHSYENNIDGHETFSSNIDGVSVLLFDNLKKRGFETRDRFEGFTLEEAKVIVETLARMHAVSIALRILKPEVFEEEVMPCLAENYTIDLSEEEREDCINGIMDVVKCFPELSLYVFKIKEMVGKVFTDMYIPRPFPKEEWGTIVHDDLWTKRLMILKSECGEPKKNSIVDLHLMVYESGVKDLIFFLFTSLTRNVFSNNLDEIIDYYYDWFIDNLKDYNLDLESYSKDKFLQEIKNVAPTEFVHIAFMLKTIFDDEGIDIMGGYSFTELPHAKSMKEVVLEYARRNWI